MTEVDWAGAEGLPSGRQEEGTRQYPSRYGDLAGEGEEVEGEEGAVPADALHLPGDGMFSLLGALSDVDAASMAVHGTTHLA